MKNVLEWLESSQERFGEKSIYHDMESDYNFHQILDSSMRIGTYLDQNLHSEKPVAVIMSRHISTIVAYLGVVYSGRAYAPIDAKLPPVRIRKILDTLQPECIFTENDLLNTVSEIITDTRILKYEEAVLTDPDSDRLQRIRNQMITTDPLYIIFTSGSTGNPKGVATSHHALMVYINAYAKVMEISDTDHLGNQSPLDYIAAIRDIYLPLKTGCEMYIIPKEYFMEPERLFDYMNQCKITAVGWSVSAFTIASSLKAFEHNQLHYLRKICFSGSIMPCKCLKEWQLNLPDARFVNQYGPTETTASCTYYRIDHIVDENEVLPIGQAYDGYRILLIKSDQTLAAPGEEGEICVIGPALALGYYNDPERTAVSFVTNPLNTAYRQRMYRTGDIGMLRDNGILEFHGRMDRQIKHMGHRVELDEVEYAANQVEGVAESCCIYVKEQEALYLFYTGTADKRTIATAMRKFLPGFMVPRRIRKEDMIKKLPNGKIDYQRMKESI